ncbi:hypothetical protein MTO96_007174 [Rhipicephalus appendiculatus]
MQNGQGSTSVAQVSLLHVSDVFLHLLESPGKVLGLIQAVDCCDGKEEVGVSQRGDKEVGEFRHGETEVAEEGRAEENTGGDDGAGGSEGAAGGADGEAEEDAKEVEYYEAGTACDGEWTEKTKFTDAGGADDDDYVNDADAAGAEEKPALKKLRTTRPRSLRYPRGVRGRDPKSLVTNPQHQC